jgi:hypothetical protein
MESLKGRNYSEDPGVDLNIILKFMFGICGLDSSGPGYGPTGSGFL